MTELADLRAAHMALAREMLPEHVARLNWDAATLGAHRSQALRALLKVAVEGSPWHRERLSTLPLDTVDAQDLTALPTMTKHDVMAHFDRMTIDPRVTRDAVEDLLAQGAGGYLFDEYTAAATGGSTGARTLMLYDRAGLAGWWLSGFRELLVWKASDPELSRRQLVVAWVTAAHPSHISALMARTFNDPSFRNVSLPVTLPIEAIVDGLNEAQADVVVAYPSAWVPLVAQARAGRLRIRPLRVWAAGEPLLPEVRAMLEATWPVPVGNRWGSTEIGAQTALCAGGFSHLAEDYAIVEPVDVHGAPVPVGERCAKLFVTNLFNQALPLIRYEITDEVTLLPGTCPCGSPTARVGDVQGRLDDWFRYPSGDVHPHVFRSVLGRCPEIVEYQVRQTERGADVAVRCADSTDLAAVAAQLRRHLIAAGLPDPELHLGATEALDRLPHTGKLKRFVPLAVAP